MMLMPSGFAKEEKFVFSAMKASDCSQVYRDWLPGECLRYSSNCRLNLSQGAGKSIFVIKKEHAIAVFLAALHVGNLSYRQTGRPTVYSLFRLDNMLQQFLQKRCKALRCLDLLEKRTGKFKNQVQLEPTLKNPPDWQKQGLKALKLTILSKYLYINSI